MKPGREICVSVVIISMSEFIHVILALGGLIAAAAVGVMCVICLLVWLGGSEQKEPSEAWRHADKS